MGRQHPWDNRGVKSNRIIVKSQHRKDVEKRVEYHKAKGFIPLMEIKNEFDHVGDPFYVCVMEREKAHSV